MLRINYGQNPPGGAVIVVGLAVDAAESRLALAGVRVGIVVALGAVLARVRAALVNVELAVPAAEAGDALAVVVVQAVDARRSVLAWICTITDN